MRIPEPIEKSTVRNEREPAESAAWANEGTPAEPAKGPFPPRARRPVYWLSGLLVVIGIFVCFFALRANSHSTEGRVATPPALPVDVAKVSREDVYNEIAIAAEFRPYAEVELHAKVSGYVTNVTVDFGDKVKVGQLLAELEVPELGDELDRAVAMQQRAEADHKDAHLAYTRLGKVQREHPNLNLVAPQDLDTAEAKDSSSEATVASAKAEVDKYQTMVAYTRITAPFAGVITKRYVDPGALIQSGTASQTQSLPLVRISDNYRLRLDFPVSVSYVKEIKLGDPVEVRVNSVGGTTNRFPAIISRFAQRVDEDTRTMLTEIEVPNPKLELVPGMYATVVLRVERRPHVLTIPTEALSADKKTSVYLVDSQHQIEERPVTLGLETPGRYEVTSGLQEGDLVIIGSRSKFRPGQKVEVTLMESLAQR